MTNKNASPAVRRKRARLPDFSKMTIEEEAEFWDTHDSADYEDEFEEMEEDIEFLMVHSQKKKPMTVRLEPDILTLLAREAKSQGVGPSTLARMAILKYLKETGRGTVLTAQERKASPRKRSRGAA